VGENKSSTNQFSGEWSYASEWEAKFDINMSLLAMVVLGSIVAVAQEHNASRRYKQVNLVSDIEGLAAVTDPNLVNPWGVAFSSTSPFWVSDNGTGVSTLYNGEGTPVPLIVTIPPPSGSTGTSTPTGTVF